MSLPTGLLDNRYSLYFGIFVNEVQVLGVWDLVFRVCLFCEEMEQVDNFVCCRHRDESDFCVGPFVLCLSHIFTLNFDTFIFLCFCSCDSCQPAHVIIGELKVQIHILSGLFTADMHVHLSNTGIYPPSPKINKGNDKTEGQTPKCWGFMNICLRVS